MILKWPNCFQRFSKRRAWPSPLPAMVCACPLISVYSKKGESSGINVALPAVFKAPVQPDIMNVVHTN